MIVRLINGVKAPFEPGAVHPAPLPRTSKPEAPAIVPPCEGCTHPHHIRGGIVQCKIQIGELTVPELQEKGCPQYNQKTDKNGILPGRARGYGKASRAWRPHGWLKG